MFITLRSEQILDLNTMNVWKMSCILSLWEFENFRMFWRVVIRFRFAKSHRTKKPFCFPHLLSGVKQLCCLQTKSELPRLLQQQSLLHQRGWTRIPGLFHEKYLVEKLKYKINPLLRALSIVMLCRTMKATSPGILSSIFGFSGKN